jgi:hypothetical protein
MTDWGPTVCVTSFAEPSVKTRLKREINFSKNINLKRSCLFFKNRKMSCHVEHFSHHFGCTFDHQNVKEPLFSRRALVTKELKYSRTWVSKSSRDCYKYFNTSRLRHMYCAEVKDKQELSRKNEKCP